MIANRFKLRVGDPELKKGALWTYWEGAYRDTGRDEGATLVLQTAGKKGWFWYIPLHNNIVSVGVVASFDYLFNGRGDHETIYNEEVDRCPAVKERVSIGKRVAGFYATKDYSYRSRQAAGDGWVLVGDAFGFLDPLYSSGVLLALKSRANWPPTPSPRAWPRATRRPPNWASGARVQPRHGPHAPAGVRILRRLQLRPLRQAAIPHLKGQLTDLLIGDLFKDKVDDVIEPMDSTKAKRRLRLRQHAGVGGYRSA